MSHFDSSDSLTLAFEKCGNSSTKFIAHYLQVSDHSFKSVEVFCRHGKKASSQGHNPVLSHHKINLVLCGQPHLVFWMSLMKSVCPAMVSFGLLIEESGSAIVWAWTVIIPLLTVAPFEEQIGSFWCPALCSCSGQRQPLCYHASSAVGRPPKRPWIFDENNPFYFATTRTLA